MARLNVNPTRMVLTSLKNRLRVAVKGHKMLKDKRDELMKRFLELARENKILREQVEALIGNVYSNFVIASAVMSSEVLEEALMYPKQGVTIEVGRKNVMSVDVPVFNFKTTTDDTANIYPYGFANTSAELDNAIENLSNIFPELLKLAAVEKEVQLLAAEIEKTRRRVNALEYIMIPQLEETIKYIQMKLDENERGNQTRLMKVKDMMVKEAIEEKQQFTKNAIDEYANNK
ncbi:MAG TPA: V-type ATP synthase subunit D [Sedimentibacter sp.]|nr:V-type ATP synthase subunit D [Sedimentibacter sp.]HPV85210.1 V-type ATP synthase subunit D [Sedimentibacter sp.]HPY55564.1 V-type ATP synthase subunit D [Sedimentibacter sp.]HQC69596.1 V-type ATP synthase subunit D [Sedimentibacter sp.]HQK52824.1 V-type ATP synthase subunit D [Sedimentibacter sp.]